MMGRLSHDQGQLFYSFCLEDVVPAAQWTGAEHLSAGESRFAAYGNALLQQNLPEPDVPTYPRDGVFVVARATADALLGTS